MEKKRLHWLHGVNNHSLSGDQPLRILVTKVVGGTEAARINEIKTRHSVYLNRAPWFAPSFSPETRLFSYADQKMASFHATYTYSHPGEDYSDDAYVVVVYATRDFKPDDELLDLIYREYRATEKVNLGVNTSNCLCM